MGLDWLECAIKRWWLQVTLGVEAAFIGGAGWILMRPAEMVGSGM